MTFLADLLIALRFFSRLPVPTTRREIELGAAGLAAAVAAVPLAGAIIGLVPAAVLVVARAAGLVPLVAAALAIAAQLGVTGALHEDGLADCADGFGGGRTRERKLAIMRDSGVGAYGACAVTLSILSRVAAIAALADGGATWSAAALVGTAALSRGLALLPLALLTPARTDGRGAAAARPAAGGMVIALVSAALIAVALPMLAGATFSRAVTATVVAVAAALAIVALARRQIGGQTGDVAGAVQQVAEVAALVVLSAG